MRITELLSSPLRRLATILAGLAVFLALLLFGCGKSGATEYYELVRGVDGEGNTRLAGSAAQMYLALEPGGTFVQEIYVKGSRRIKIQGNAIKKSDGLVLHVKNLWFDGESIADSSGTDTWRGQMVKDMVAKGDSIMVQELDWREHGEFITLIHVSTEWDDVLKMRIPFGDGGEEWTMRRSTRAATVDAMARKLERRTPVIESLALVKTTASAIQMYVADNDDMLPVPRNWESGISPYFTDMESQSKNLKERKLWLSWNLDINGWAYSKSSDQHNPLKPGWDRTRRDEQTIDILDTSRSVWALIDLAKAVLIIQTVNDRSNHSVSGVELPEEGPHEEGNYAVGCADGSVKIIPKSEIDHR